VSTEGHSDEELITELLDLPEGSRVEFKRVGPKNDRKLETIVALANTDGGLLILGVEDPKRASGRDRLFGVEENPESVDELRRLLIHRVTPHLKPPDTDEPGFVYLACTLRDGTRGRIAVVRVTKSAAVHFLMAICLLSCVCRNREWIRPNGGFTGM